MDGYYRHVPRFGRGQETEPCSAHDALHQHCRYVSRDGTEQGYPAGVPCEVVPSLEGQGCLHCCSIVATVYYTKLAEPEVFWLEVIQNK